MHVVRSKGGGYALGQASTEASIPNGGYLLGSQRASSQDEHLVNALGLSMGASSTVLNIKQLSDE